MAKVKQASQANGQKPGTRYGELVKHTVADTPSGITGDLEQSAKARIQHQQ